MSDAAILLALVLSLFLVVGGSRAHAPASPPLPVASGAWADEGFTLPAGCAIEPEPAPSLNARTE